MSFGAILGFVVFLLLGYYVVIQSNPADARYTKSLVCLASYGGSIGGSFHAIVMKRWVLGYFCLAASFVSLAAISMMRL